MPIVEYHKQLDMCIIKIFRTIQWFLKNKKMGLLTKNLVQTGEIFLFKKTILIVALELWAFEVSSHRKVLWHQIVCR